MKTNLLFTLVSTVSLTCAAAATLENSFPPAGYHLVWSDTFDGDKLDESKWIYRTDVKASSSQRPQNVTVENGNLVLHMLKESDRGKQYTGGGVITKQRFRYGYYEARARMFGGSGWHESVWSMAATDGSTTYPENIRTEIDGMEFDSVTPTKGHMGLIIWQGPKQSKHQTCSPGVYRAMLGADATEGFHTYGYDWSEKSVKYYFDGDLRCVIDYPPSAGEHDEISFWLTAIGYEVGGQKMDDSKLPGKMMIDFAAFYAR